MILPDRSFKQVIKKNILPLAIIILYLLFFYSLYHNSFTSPWERDEGEYAYSAWLMQKGHTPYVDSFLQKPPLIVYTYYLAELIRPLALWPPRVLAFLFTLATCLLIALIARKIYGRRAAWFALWVSPLLLSSPYITALSANTEKFMLLPLVGLLALFVFWRGRENNFIFFIAGVLTALAVLYKPIALPPAGLLILFWIIQRRQSNSRLRNLVAAIASIFLGGLLTTALVLSYFLVRGAGPELWQQVVVYNASYAADMAKYFPGQFEHYLSIFWFNWWPLFLIALVSFFWRPKLSGLLWSLLGLSLLTVICSPIGHYYLLVMPFFVLICAGAAEKILDRWKIRRPEWDNAALAALIVLVFTVAGFSSGEQFFMSPNALSVWIYGTENPFLESQLMADKIQQNTLSSDRIFVIGSEPQLYYFSQRLADTEFDITYPFIINTPWRSQFQASAIAGFRKQAPAAIILSQQASSGAIDANSPHAYYDYLLGEIKNNYRLIGGTAISQPPNADPVPVWVSPAQAQSASLLLFIKNK